MAIDATSYYLHFIEKNSDMYIHYAKSNFPAKTVVVKKKSFEEKILFVKS